MSYTPGFVPTDTDAPRYICSVINLYATLSNMKITTTNFSIFLIMVLTLVLIAVTVYSEQVKVGPRQEANAVAVTR